MITKLKENLKKAILFLTLFIIGFFIFLSLVSHNPNDNSFYSFDSSVFNYQNYLGTFGSFLSSSLLSIFGKVAFLIPIFFIIHSIRIILNEEINWYNFSSLPFLLIISCLLIEIVSENNTAFFLNSGILGEGLGNYHNYFFKDFEYKTYLLLVIAFINIMFLFFSFNINTSKIRFIFNLIFKIITNIFIFFAYTLKFSKELNLKSLFEKDVSPKTIKKSRSIKRHVSPFVSNSNFLFPSLELLEKPKKNPSIDIENKKNTEINTAMLSNVLSDFKINGQITEVKQGPIVTLFELTPAPGTQSSSVIRLSEDIARSMGAKSARISTIPGKDALGIEIPNKNRDTVFLRELLNDDTYKNTKFKLPLTLGKDIFGKPVVVDLAKMPHLLVAGTTGSGKSVGINAMLLSLLYSLPPEECRLILIDPKMLELSVYKDIPHLLTEVVTDPKKAISALKWTVKEMETRYRMMTHLGVREIEDYNIKVKKILDDGEVIFKETQVGYDSETGKPVMEKKALDLNIFSKIVVVVDELADLMITSGKEIESAIQRLSQMARAAGIHLIVATQRPSVDVITGTIKSNFPTRISYKVVNKINSRTILEEQGAEQLLGQGDLLITMLGDKLLRVHGPFVKTDEVQAVVDHLKSQGEPEYLQSVTIEEEESENFSLGFSDGGDELYDKAVSIVCREKKASTSFIQRHLQIGYNRAARIIEKMEAEGIVSPANHVGRREVLVGKDN